MQNRLAFPMLEHLLTTEAFEQVVEIGTAYGGTCLFLSDQAVRRGFSFVSYDIVDRYSTPAAVACEARIVRDCFHSDTIAEIGEAIGRGKTLILCDGADKAREFNTFTPMLKTGDFIMAHDHAPDHAFFQAFTKGVYWDWMEIANVDLAPSLRSPVRYQGQEFWKASWICCQKR